MPSDDAPDMPQKPPRNALDYAPDMPQMMPQMMPQTCPRHAPDMWGLRYYDYYENLVVIDFLAELGHSKNWNMRWIKKCEMQILRRRQMHCDGASEDAAGLSTTTRDVSSDRGVTIKMSRHWMRPLNTRIYAHYIPSRAHCPIQYSLCLQRDASMHISHLFASLLRRHIWTFSSPFDTAWVVFGLETSAWFCAANIF